MFAAHFESKQTSYAKCQRDDHTTKLIIHMALLLRFCAASMLTHSRSGVELSNDREKEKELDAYKDRNEFLHGCLTNEEPDLDLS